MIYLLKIHDIGSSLLITGTDQKEDNENIPADMYKRVSERLFNEIERDLKTHELTLAKDTPFCVSGFDIKKRVVDVLKIQRADAYSKARSAFSQRLDFSIIFDCFQFIQLNNFFMTKGYNIVSDQEETFFEIISSDDDALKDKLESFLVIQDSFSKHTYIYERFTNFEAKLQGCKTEEEVSKELLSFLALMR